MSYQPTNKNRFVPGTVYKTNELSTVWRKTVYDLEMGAGVKLPLGWNTVVVIDTNFSNCSVLVLVGDILGYVHPVSIDHMQSYELLYQPS